MNVGTFVFPAHLVTLSSLTCPPLPLFLVPAFPHHILLKNIIPCAKRRMSSLAESSSAFLLGKSPWLTKFQVGERTEGSKVFNHQKTHEVLVDVAPDNALLYHLSFHLKNEDPSAQNHPLFSAKQRGTLEIQHFRSDLGIHHGRWVFEATILSPLVTAIGWSNIEDVVCALPH